MSYPMWLYHKEKGKKVFETEAEVEAAGEGWVDSPAAFEADKEIPASSGHKGHKDGEPVEKMTVAELKDALAEKGVTQDEMEGLKKAELLEMLKGL